MTGCCLFESQSFAGNTATSQKEDEKCPGSGEKFFIVLQQERGKERENRERIIKGGSSTENIYIYIYMGKG